MLRKQQPVLGGYDPSLYATERLWATAPDGTQVPMSVVYRRDTPRDGTAPCLLYGYGAYEHSIDPVFSPFRLSLLDRGFVFAIAHVRGGGELGRRWYEDGKLLAKPNTFTDFVACARHLAETGWTRADRTVARGGSAGGLLIGASANLAPELFTAMVAEVPFVDCLTTMLDDTLPLTVIEWDEWGDPGSDPKVYEVMKSYSPYDNVHPGHYPSHVGHGRPGGSPGRLLGADQMGPEATGRRSLEPGPVQSGARPPATPAPRAATTPGGKRLSSWPSSSTRWAGPADQVAWKLMSKGEWNPVGKTTGSPFRVTLTSLAAPRRRRRFPVAGMDRV